jgi:hypothetical protein
MSLLDVQGTPKYKLSLRDVAEETIMMSSQCHAFTLGNIASVHVTRKLRIYLIKPSFVKGLEIFL